jgi:hypothetical protein
MKRVYSAQVHMYCEVIEHKNSILKSKSRDLTFIPLAKLSKV